MANRSVAARIRRFNVAVRRGDTAGYGRSCVIRSMDQAFMQEFLRQVRNTKRNEFIESLAAVSSMDYVFTRVGLLPVMRLSPEFFTRRDMTDAFLCLNSLTYYADLLPKALFSGLLCLSRRNIRARGEEATRSFAATFPPVDAGYWPS